MTVQILENNKISNEAVQPFRCNLIGFWAAKRPDLCEMYITGHEKILIDHGLEGLISTDKYWIERPDVFVVLAYYNDTPLGGIRLETKNNSELLPFEKSLKPFDANIERVIKEMNYSSIYEACGLWNAKIAAGNDLGIFLCRVCVAVAPLLNIDAILSLNGVYTYKIPKDMGSQILKNIGENGLFKYPVERFHSALWIQDDLVNMKRAIKECRQRVLSLRQSFNQTCLERNEKNGIEITYELDL